MTERQSRFVHHYVETGNATKSALASGYSPKTAYAIGGNQLKKIEIQNAIAEKKREIYDETRLKERLTDVLECPDNQGVLLKAVEIGMRERAMLTDRNINENIDISPDALSRAAEEAIQALSKPAKEAKSVIEPKSS